MKKFLGVCSDIILVLVMVYILAVVGFYGVNSIGSLKTTVCISPSMHPTIMTNGFVVTDHATSFEDVQKGDIIMVDEGYGRYVNHRVYQVSYATGEKTLLTAGDNELNLVDPWTVTEEDFIGEVVNYCNYPRFLMWVLQGDITEQVKGEITAVDYVLVLRTILLVLGFVLLGNFSLVYHKNKNLIYWIYEGFKKKMKEEKNMNEIVMETVHGRAKKNKTSFKGVVNGIVLSGLVLATIVGSTTPAMAAEMSIKDMVNNYESSVTQEFGVSVEQSITAVKNTIEAVFKMKNSGSVSDSQLRTLANQIYMLEKAMQGNHSKANVETVKVLLNNAEKAVTGLENKEAKNVEVAIAFARHSLGIEDTIVVNQSKTANTALKSFSDVPRSHWAYNSIMQMAQRGMIAGTTTPVNGVGTFAPEMTMTRAQFVTVVTRYMYANELKNYANVGGAWYAGNYEIAVDKGLIKESEFSMESMNTPMTRQEMAMVLVRAMEQLGEENGTLISTSKIPDYNKIGTYYRNYVQIAYSKGLICGTDAAGTFNPMGTLNRAQAATVLYRLVDVGTRAEVDLSTVTPKEEVQQTAGKQTFYEGQKHNKPQAGDVVIKADGTKVVIQYDANGILRAEGCDIYTGVVLDNGNVVRDGMVSYEDQRVFRKDSITGEMLSMGDWNKLRGELNPNGKYAGDYDGEIMNTWYKWNSAAGLWSWIGPVK